MGEATATVSIGISDTEVPSGEQRCLLPSHVLPPTYPTCMSAPQRRWRAEPQHVEARAGEGPGEQAPAGSRRLLQVLRALSGARWGRRRGGGWGGRPGFQTAEARLPAVSVPHTSGCQGRLLPALAAVRCEAALPLPSGTRGTLGGTAASCPVRPVFLPSGGLRRWAVLPGLLLPSPPPPATPSLPSPRSPRAPPRRGQQLVHSREGLRSFVSLEQHAGPPGSLASSWPSLWNVLDGRRPACLWLLVNNCTVGREALSVCRFPPVPLGRGSQRSLTPSSAGPPSRVSGEH